MSITTTLSKLKAFFFGWHEVFYDEIHRVTNNIISNHDLPESKYAFSSYGASKLQEQIDAIDLTQYASHVNGTQNIANANVLGHVKIINNLNETSYNAADPKALSAYQGNILKNNISTNTNNITNHTNQIKKLQDNTSKYKMYVGRYHDNDNTGCSGLETAQFNTDPEYDAALPWSHGFAQNAKLTIGMDEYIICIIKNADGSRLSTDDCGKFRVVFNINGVHYYRKLNNQGIGSVQLTWGRNDDSRVRAKLWSDTWMFVEVTLLTDEDNVIDKSIHKVINYDPGYFHTYYNDKENEWRTDMNIPSESKNAYMYDNKLRRKKLGQNDRCYLYNGYPNNVDR